MAKFQRRSDMGSARQDDARAAEVAGMVDGEHETRAEEWKESEPVGEDQPDTDMVPHTQLTGEPPPGMSSHDLTVRSDVARFLGASVYPASRDELADKADDDNAPDWVVRMLEALPDGHRYQNVQEVMTALGFGTEDHRF